MTTDDTPESPKMGISAALRAAHGEDYFTTGVDKTAHRWAQICICGHPSVAHDTAVGGTRKLNKIPWVVTWPPCTGPVFRGSGAAPLNPLYDKEVDNGQPTTAYVVKCFCEQFTPIAEIDKPGAAFNRMPNQIDHAFEAGIRAMRARARNAGVPDPDPRALRRARITPTEEQLDEMIDARIRWLIDERRCASCGTTSATNPLIFPVYSGLPLGKVSEFRCTDCRPTA